MEVYFSISSKLLSFDTSKYLSAICVLVITYKLIEYLINSTNGIKKIKNKINSFLITFLKD